MQPEISIVTTDGTYLYVSENNNHTLRKIELSTATVTTLAGANPVQVGAWVDATGTAGYNQLQAMTTDGHNLYITDKAVHAVRKLQ